MTTWTPDRPTKPGKYQVYVAPEKRSRIYPGYLIVTLDAHDLEDLERNELYAEALWRPYVEPPDPFAEPVPVEMYRMSDDAKTPNLRLILSVDPGEVVLYEADMTSRSATAKETAVHDKIIMSPADARWLRDALQQVDLSDQPEVTSAAPVPSLREKIEALPDLVLGSGRVIGGAVDRGAVLALLDEVTR